VRVGNILITDRWQPCYRIGLWQRYGKPYLICVLSSFLWGLCREKAALAHISARNGSAKAENRARDNDAHAPISTLKTRIMASILPDLLGNTRVAH
jgi:hypothetical protein